MAGQVQDVICLSIPAEIDPEMYLGHPDARVAASLYVQLSRIAEEQVWRQWPGRQPVDVTWQETEWLLTQDLEDIEKFQPAHDCAECLLGKVRAEMFLREFPGRWVALGNLTYTPKWESDDDEDQDHRQDLGGP